MKTPVLIAAYNEEAYIGKTLDRLDTQTLDPIVITNGTDDHTADIARSFSGVTVIEREEKGKLPALQHGLRELGSAALAPVLLLDADSYPLRPKAWASHMLGELTLSQPEVVTGTVFFAGESPIADMARAGRSFVRSKRVAKAGESLAFGANMLLSLQNEDTLGAILEAPHVWYGDDRFMRDVVVNHGGAAHQNADLRGTVVTSARYVAPLYTRLFRNAQSRHAFSDQAYDARGAQTVQFSYDRDGKLRPLQK